MINAMFTCHAIAAVLLTQSAMADTSIRLGGSDNASRTVIQVKDQSDVVLHDGELAVIPKGVEHCPKSNGPSYILMFEPAALVSKGD